MPGSAPTGDALARTKFAGDYYVIDPAEFEGDRPSGREESRELGGDRCRGDGGPVRLSPAVVHRARGRIGGREEPPGGRLPRGGDDDLRDPVTVALHVLRRVGDEPAGRGR